MKIIFVCEAVFPENKGGVERWFNLLSGELAKRGHKVLYLNAAGVNDERNGVEYRSITKEPWFYLPGGVRSRKQAINFAISAFKVLRQENTNAVYATSVPILSAISVGLLGVTRKKTLTFIEWFEIWPLKYWREYSGILSGAIGWMLQIIALQMGKYRIVYTERASHVIRRLNLPKQRERVLILPGLCSPDFTPENSNNGFRNDITFLGRFVDEKQPCLAIEAVIEFIKSGWDGTFWVIGKGPSIESMRTLLNINPLEAKQIRIIENASDEEVESHLRSSFVLLHPSKREGYGLASVEAAYLGTPSLLLNYPNNATLDLEISPNLVVNNLSSAGISTKLKEALRDQNQIRLKTLEWASKASSTRSIISTANEIEKLLGALHG